MYKTVLTILFLFILSQAPAQSSLVEQAKRVVSIYSTVTEPSDQAKKETERIMDAFFLFGEEGLDQYLNSMDDSWYSGIDVYIGEDWSAIIELIESDDEAEFRLNGMAVVTMADDSVNYLIVVYSYP